MNDYFLFAKAQQEEYTQWLSREADCDNPVEDDQPAWVWRQITPLLDVLVSRLESLGRPNKEQRSHSIEYDLQGVKE